MSYLPKNDLDQLCDEISDHVCGTLPERLASHQPHVVGAMPISLPIAQVKQIVRVGLDIVVQYAGPLIESGVISSKEQLRTILSDRTLAFLAGLIHDVQDAK